MSKKIDDYLDLKVKNESFGVSVERIFALKIIETFNKYEYAQFEEEIKRRTRVKILYEIMKLIAQEIEENGFEVWEIADKTLKGIMFDTDTGKFLMVLDERQLHHIRQAYHFGIFSIKQFTGGQNK